MNALRIAHGEHLSMIGRSEARHLRFTSNQRDCEDARDRIIVRIHKIAACERLNLSFSRLCFRLRRFRFGGGARNYGGRVARC
jgi:hypothetical protein